MRLHRLLILVPLVAALLVPAVAVAGGEEESGGAAATAMERTAFDHDWNDVRYYNHIADYTAATGNTITSFSEAPMLAEMVAAGELPPVEERLPDDPYVVVPYQEIGQYGGYAFVGRDGTGHWGDAHLLIGIEQLNRIAGDLSTQSPNVATDYELSADAKVLTVTLREGIKWSTGEPFTTEDIKFWYEDIILNEELTPNPARFLQPGGELMKMNFLDDQTFQFTFAIANPVAVEWLPHPNRGVTPIKQAKHYFSQFHPTYVGADKAAALAKEAGFENWVQHFSDLNNSWSELPKFNTERPMLTAYRLAEIGTDLARWDRNPYYWKIDVEGNQLPYMDGINVELLQDLQVFAGKIIAGEFTISIGWYAPLSDYPLMKRNEEAGDYTVELWPSLEGSATLFQVNRTVDDPVLAPIFADSRFSHALSLSLDRDEINEVVFQGLGTPRQHTLINASIYFEPRFAEAYAEHDVERANQILDELGLTWDANREWRLLPDGNRFSVVMDTGSAVLPIHELAVEQWKEIGMEVTMKSFSYQQSEERSQTNQMQLYGGSAGFNARSEAFVASPLFFLPQRQGWENPWGNQWALWYVTGGDSGIEPPDEVKRNIKRWEAMIATLDLDEKIRLGKEILASQADNLWVIGTVGEVPLPMPRSNKLRNFPERGGHDWSIGSWTGPQHPSQFYLERQPTPVSVSDTTIRTTRVFTELNQIANYAKNPAYGIVAFTSKPTNTTLERYIFICNGFVSTLVDAEESTVPLEAQLVTMWPTENGYSESLNSRSLNNEDTDTLCQDAVQAIDLEFSLKAIRAVSEIYDTSGVGPYVIAWSSYCNTCMLFVDLTRVVTEEEATRVFRIWREHIEGDPSYWKKLNTFWMTVRQLIIKMDKKIDVLGMVEKAVPEALTALVTKGKS